MVKWWIEARVKIMIKWLLVGAFLGGTAIAFAQQISHFTFMQVHVVNQGKTENERFFLGRLPHKGEAVEMIYVGDDPLTPGMMNFQLRVKGWW